MDPNLHSPHPHVSVAEVYTAAQAANPTAGHPPYVEMITSAITALNERNGSSKKAVEKYISGAYSNLPPQHSDLLTYHLHQLKQSGYLRTVKKSYKLAHRSRILTPVDAFSPSPTIGSSRKRGRPPKSKPLILFQSNEEPQLSSQVQAISDLTHFSLKPAVLPSPTSKKRPGRPPKKASASPSMLNGATAENGPSAAYSPKDFHPIQSNSHVQAISELTRSSPKSGKLQSPISKKRPGRPPKKISTPPAVPHRATSENGPSAIYSPGDLLNISGGTAKRKAGRPSKLTPKSPRAQQSGSRPLGVVGPAEVHLPVSESAPTDTRRRRGRPKKTVNHASIRVAKTLYMRRGRPAGRPRKNVLITRHGQSDRGERVSYEVLKAKVACLQERIGQAVGVLRQHLTTPNIAGAATALQDLEKMSKVDVANTPLQQVKVQSEVTGYVKDLERWKNPCESGGKV